ncbi:hypothetical protein [Haloarchaeobius baliensis]|uniref:hypothetical protein n=1 Tax=Haloarchaeobius baliensis TaxID=1670458 RepID=UPI003F883AA1
MTDDGSLPTTRRTLLQTLSGATVATLLSQGAAAIEDTGLRIDSFDDRLHPPTDAVREARWRVHDRRMLTHDPVRDAYLDGSSSPLWIGASQTELAPVNISWEPYGNPDTEADERGCWRVTFDLSSTAYSLHAQEIHYDDNMVERADESAGYMLSDETVNEGLQRGKIRIGNLIRVEGPPLDDEAETWKHIAFGVRRDQDLFSAIDGDAIVELLANDESLRQDFAHAWGELVGSLGLADAENARNEYALIQDAQQDSKAVRDIALVVTGAALTALATLGLPLVAGAATLVSVVGFLFGVEGVLSGPGPRPVPYYRGFELRDSPERGSPITGHNALFDVYVSPGERVEFDVSSEHDLDQSLANSISRLTSNHWTVEIDMRYATHPGVSLESLYSNVSLTRGEHQSQDDTDHLDQFFSNLDPGPTPVVTIQNGHLPESLSLNEEFDPADGVPYVEPGTDIEFDAYDTKLWFEDGWGSEDIYEYEWAVYRLGPVTNPTEHAFDPDEISTTQQGWPNIGRDSVVESGRGDHPDWRCSLTETGTYAVVLAVSDARDPSEGGAQHYGYRNFVTQKFVYGSYITISDLYATELVDEDDRIEGPIPTGTGVRLVGESSTMNGEQSVEAMWVVPKSPGFVPTEELLDRTGPWLEELEFHSGTETEISFAEEGTYHPLFVVRNESGVTRSENLEIEAETELRTLYADVESSDANGADAGPPVTVGETLVGDGEFVYTGANEVEETWIRPKTEALHPEPHMLEEVGLWTSDIEIMHGSNPSFSFSEPGEYDVMYHVEDPIADAADYAHVTVEVVEPGDSVDHPFVDEVHAELEMAHDGDRLTVGDHVTLDATSSYAERNRSILGYDWNITATDAFIDLGDPGKRGILSEGTQRMPLYGSFEEAGIYSPGVMVYAWNPNEERVEVSSDRVSFTVFDDSSPTADIRRLPPNDEAVADWKVAYINRGGEPFWEDEEYVAWFSAGESDLVAGVDEFRWTIDGEESTEISAGPVYHIFDEPGSYDVTLELVYDSGETATTTQEVSIGGGTTNAEITQLTSGDDTVQDWKLQWVQTGGDPFWEDADHLVWLSARNSARTEDAEEFRWEFAHPGDGPGATSYSEGPVHHEYDRADTFEVRLEVVYSDGSTASTTATVEAP